MSDESRDPPDGSHVETLTVRIVALLIRALVDHPEEVELRLIEGRYVVIFEIKVHPEDIRRVIGRKGRTANAIRELLTNLGARVDRRYQLEILEPDGRARGHGV